MPRVPVINEQSVSTRQLPAARLNVDARGSFGEPVAAGLQRLTRGIEDASDVLEAQRQKAKQRADAIATAEVEAQLTDTVTTELHDKQNGYLWKRGRQAFEESASVLERLEKRRVELAKGLGNDDQRRIFEGAARNTLQRVRQTIERHAGEQMRVAEQDALEVRRRSALGAIYADPSLTDTQGYEVELKMGELGQGEDEIAKWRAQATATAIKALLERGDVEGARGRLEAGRAMLGADAVRLQKDIDSIGKARGAEARALSIVSGARSRETGWVDPDVALAAIDLLPEAERDEVRERVEHRVRLAEGEKNREIGEVYRRVFSTYLDKGTLSAADPRDIRWLTEHSPEDMDKLRSKARADSEYYRKKREGNGTTGETDEQREAYLEFEQDVLNNPDKYRALSAHDFTRLWGPRLSNSGYKAAGRVLANEQARLKKAEESGELVDEKTFRLSAEAEAARAGITSKKQKDAFLAYMNRWHADWKASHKNARPSWTDVQKAQADALLEGRRKRDWYLPDPSVRRFEVPKPEEFYVEGQEPASAPAPTEGGTGQSGAAGESPAPPTIPPRTPVTELDLAAPTVPRKERVLQLQREGKSPRDIVIIMRNEGY